MTSSGRERLSSTVKALEGYSGPDGFRPWQDEYTRLVPAEDCRALVEAIEAEPTSCQRPAEYARRLLAGYRSTDLIDPDGYVMVISAVFASFPETFAKRVCHPVEGLPGRLKWVPTVAEVVEALKAEDEKRKAALYRARWTIEEHERRKARREEEARLARRTPEEKERAQQRYEQLKAEMRLKAMQEAGE
jgi:hypothetical protein